MSLGRFPGFVAKLMIPGQSWHWKGMHLDVLPTGLTGFVILMRDDLFHQVSKANIDNI
jgi:hypothetical protein